MPKPDLNHLRELGRLLAEPIDFEQLEKDGAVEPAPGGWYRVLDWKKVPIHARIKARRTRWATRWGVTRSMYVNFVKPDRRIARALEKAEWADG